MRKHMVLIVDDEPPIVRLARAKLQAEGYAVITAGSGEEALKVLEDERPDLMILDLMMPGVDGTEVLRRVREVPRMQAMRVAMFSAVTDPAVRDHRLRRGAQDFWTKASFDFGQLAERVERLLSEDASSASRN